MPDIKNIRIGNQVVGYDRPTFIVAEIGINHNGDLDTAMRLIDVAVSAGCDAVKFQKRTPELCVPEDQRSVERETPWGRMTYLAYREKVEFGFDEYEEIDRYCRKKGALWFASCWDIPSTDFMHQFDPPCYKVASATLTDLPLVRHINKQFKPVVLSTGMSTMEEIKQSVSLLQKDRLVVAHSTSSYACSHEELNLRMIQTLSSELGCLIGYSGHEDNIVPSCVAVALGAVLIERHITLDRNMWGSDHKASLNPEDLHRLVADIRQVEQSLGDGVKRVYETELPSMAKLRNCGKQVAGKR
jgi:N-acetylneuraminate synthase